MMQRLAKIVHANNDLTNSQLCSLPLAFREPSHATDYQVGTKTPAVVTHRSKHSIRRDQERKDIEAVFCVASDEASPLACRVLNIASDLLCVPGASVHKTRRHSPSIARCRSSPGLVRAVKIRPLAFRT